MATSMQADFSEFIQRIWQNQVQFVDLVNYAETLKATPWLAAALYRTWLQRINSPFNGIAWFNLGVILFGEGDAEGGREAYQNALAITPRFPQALANLGLVYERLGNYAAAIAQWEKVEEMANPDVPDERLVLISSLNNSGRLQETLKQYAPACNALEKSLLLNPDQPDAIHHLVFLRQKQCRWPIYEPVGQVTPESFRQHTSALAMLNISDDPEAQLAAALNYSRRKIPVGLPQLAPAGGYQHDKIRIAYCSGDFCTHPVAMLTVELFESHDKNHFEIYAFCWSRDDQSPLRQRILNAVDHYIPVHGMEEEAIAKLIREHEIDILVDLQGQTSGAKATMLAHRPAPVQITYLGLPATTGLPCIDYVIADRFLIPEEHAHLYSEKPLYMPDVFQVSDRKRESSPPPTKKSCGLPAKKFVFCSFNNNHKYTLEVFTTWMNILRRVPNSVLWLLADNPWAKANLQKAAEVQGIDPKRLVFAERAAPADYLARYQIVDLFLDTFPFNAGTTANDALWMGLPVLTMSGRSFASRMAGALLTAAGLPELITENLAAYEEKAVALAQDAKACKALKQKLAQARESGPLFDTEKFTRNLEAAYQQLVTGLSKQRQEKPAHTPKKMNKITSAVNDAEQKLAQGDVQGAIAIYRHWLKHSHAQHDWAIQFNLGILLRDSGDIPGARKAFLAVLKQKPDFIQARAALEQLATVQVDPASQESPVPELAPVAPTAYRPNILIIRHAAIGDVILTLPIIRQIYEDHQGECHIDVITGCREVFANNPWVRGTLSPEDVSKQQIVYEKIINLDLAYERYPKLHIIDAYEKVAFGSPGHVKNRQPELFPSASDAAYVEQLLAPLANRRLMVVHMRNGAWPSRNISIDIWRSAIEKVLANTDVTIVEIGSRTDLTLEGDYEGRIVNLFDRLTLAQLSLVIKRSALFFGIDSGTLHVAAGTDTPIVCLFTSAHHDLRKPFRQHEETFIPVAPAIPCYGCQARFAPPITGVICDQGDPMAPPCRDKFNVDEIAQALLKGLSQNH